ncbi:MAG TPA: transglycosylase SLT domain-containing protein [Thermoanaerobaculia bacterium]|nr:transglycosylase SLT domain-containing protein [Thermoanaerobaculia bacterium]
MRRRLFALLAVAAVSGALAGTVASAKGRSPAAARIPAIPRAHEVANACPVPLQFRAAFTRAARDTDLPLAMLVAVGQVESNLVPTARSNADARGLLQVLPSTAAALNLDVNRPETNVLAGARYLRLLLDRFQSPDLALAAYNAGPTAVADAGGAPSPAVATYVANVTSLWRALRGCR